MRARLALLAALLAASAAPAQLRDAVALRPGTYQWSGPVAGGPVGIVVSLRRQLAYVYRDGALIGLSAVSTGKPGHGTPVGEFTILEKSVHHRSNLYSNAPMPFMQRLTWSGVAIHAGHNPGFPASHGCIRVPLAFAKLLFAATRLGATVRVTDEERGPPAPVVTMAAATVPAPRATPSWLEQSQDDYVSWGGEWRLVGLDSEPR